MNRHFFKICFHICLGIGIFSVIPELPAVAQRRPDTGARTQATAAEHFQQGNITTAIQLWSRDIRENRSKPSALYNRAQAYVLIDQNTFALKDLNEIIEIQGNKTPASVFVVKGIVLSKQNQIEASIENFNRAEQLEPSALVYNNRALAYQKLGQYKLAIKDLEKSIQLEPTPLHRVNLANVNLKMRRFDAVIGDMTQVIKQTPQFYPAYLVRGIARYNQNDFQSAIKDFVTSLRLKPGQAQAYYYAGLSFEALNHKEEAVENFILAADLYLQQNQPEHYHQILTKADEVSASINN